MRNKKYTMILALMSLLIIGFSATTQAADQEKSVNEKQTLSSYFVNKSPSTGLNQVVANNKENAALYAYCPENSLCRFDRQCGAGFCFAPYGELGVCVCF